MSSHPHDEETASTTPGRFSAVEPLDRLQGAFPAVFAPPTHGHPRVLPTTSVGRRRASSAGASLDQDEHLPEKVIEQQEQGISVSETAARDQTVLYLAYGSNMASATFLGRRGIKPLSQIPVLVPGLRLTFDLPGLPYLEPCFAATRVRKPLAQEEDNSNETDSTDEDLLSEKAGLLETERVQRSDYHEHRWHKPLIGVVYEVTLADYAKIIATEGGGRGYLDVVIDCYPFAEDYKPTDPVPAHPRTSLFKAHTLLSPGADETRDTPLSMTTQITPKWPMFDVGQHMRPDPEYAQPSARYLNLIVTGAGEHDLPVSYREYLSQIQTYKITTTRQKIGKVIFLALWGPIVLLVLKLSRHCAGPDGRNPPWLVALANFKFVVLWASYDYVFKGLFGDGERTLTDTNAA
ncbi:hypothetical protein N7492_001954 [Penicillium capsulatum]|uniref:gamma-glutamylcyclotransferase n=1 Tax=Penicillium capsulatum TaxID=69766 RepID=A0A9W9IJ74_9EURO|nr:hypothetical protein N7492_001954 [Penicillium capsulatum]KAJ6123424.1 hypothetical protein N7512_005889 [Penicillium capsulatum]